MKKSLGLGRTFCGALMVFALILVACQPSTLVSTLENVIAAAEIAVPVIGSAVGLSPQTQAAIVSYLQLVDTAAAQASVILAGPGTSAEKSAQIVAAFAGIAQGCNCVPPGTPQVVVNVINAVAQAVVRFIGNFHPAAARQAEGAKPVSFKVKAHDVAALANIRTRAEQNLAKLKDLKK